MALINCPNCGAQVSEHATRCPHCGAPVCVSGSYGTPPPPPPRPTPPRPNWGNNNYPTPQPPRNSGSGNGWIIVLVIVIIVLIGVIIAMFASRSNNSEAEVSDHDDTTLVVGDIVEDIAASREDFTSPDLAFFNLHGPVKSMTETAESSSTTYYFDRDGNCSNIGNWLNSSYKVKTSRNKAGYVTSLKISTSDPVMQYSTSISWKNGQIVATSGNGWEWWDQTYYKYDSDGFITSEYSEMADDSQESKISITYAYNAFDNYHNWTSCTQTGRERKNYTGEDDEEIEKINKTITRIIEYYD